VKRTFLLTPEAKKDLQDILSEIAQDSPATAERLRREFFSALQRLGQSPGIGHYHEELLSKKYRFWNFYSYVVAYAWQTKPIRIISIVHGARHLAAFFVARKPD